MKVVLSHPTGNANVRAALSGLRQADVLQAFFTTIATFSGDLLDKISNMPGGAELRRRSFETSLSSITHAYPWREAARLIALKMKLKQLVAHETGLFCVDKVYQALDRKVAGQLFQLSKAGATAVYAYDDGAYHSFGTAKNLGLTTIYDLPIGYWRAERFYLQEELEHWPEWKATIPAFMNSDEKLGRKDEEIKMADRIFVASSFTEHTLSFFPGSNSSAKVIPYGFPAPANEKRYRTRFDNTPLKLLFVGGLSQRKGIANLFAAVDKFIDKIELTVVGHKSGDNCEALNRALSKHRWIPSLSHHEVLQLMYAADVLVFPSLFEGFGLVITEAMSQGTPVITTERTAGPDLISNDENGWLVKAGATEKLEELIGFLLEHPEDIERNGMAARATAAARPWSLYGEQLAASLSI